MSFKIIVLLLTFVFCHGRHNNGNHCLSPHTKCGDHCCRWASNENCDNVCCDNGDCSCDADNCDNAKNILSFVEKIMKAAKLGGCAGAKVNCLKILSNKVYFSHPQCP